MEFTRLIRLTLLILILVNQADELFCVKFGVFFTLKVHMMTTKELLKKCTENGKTLDFRMFHEFSVSDLIRKISHSICYTILLLTNLQNAFLAYFESM